MSRRDVVYTCVTTYSRMPVRGYLRRAYGAVSFFYGAYGAVLFFHPSITRIGLADPWSFFRSVVPLHPARSLTRSWFCSFFGSCRRRKQMLASARSPVVMLMLILDVLRSVKQSRTIQISRSREFARHRERAVPLQGLPHWWRQTLPGLDDWRKAVRLRRPNELVDGVRQGSIVLFSQRARRSSSS